MRIGSVVLVTLVSLALFMVTTSCGRKAKTAEESEAEKAITAQWSSFLKAIDDKDIDGFTKICSKKVLESRSKEKLADILSNSRKSRAGKAVIDYDITSYKFNKDITEATIILKNRQQWQFIKEEGQWRLNNL